MKRLFLITLAALLLAGIGVVVWTLTGLPPVRMVWRYGISYGPEPTGRTLTVEGVEFVEIGPGCFLMGSARYAKGGDFLGLWCSRLGLPWGDHPKQSMEMPVHWVEFQRGFWIARMEVPNNQYEACDPEHVRGEHSQGGRDPVVDVSWEDAKKYCAWLSEQSGLPLRLPSESEWECACRASAIREFCFGDDEMRIPDYAWFRGNSGRAAHEVGTRRANAWGLHDLHGNVWEWCEDTWHPSYEDAPTDGTAWTEGGQGWEPGVPIRIYRGGCFFDPAEDCRSAGRDVFHAGSRYKDLGFRPAFSALAD